MPNWDEMQDSQELGRLGNSLANTVPSGMTVPGEKHMPDWYMEFEEDMAYLEHYLKGEFFDPTNKKSPWVKKGKALVNDAGVVMIIGYLRGTAYTKNKIMTQYPNWDIAMGRVRDICFPLNELLHKHYCLEDIGIDLPDISIINAMARSIVIDSVLRALFGTEQKRIASTTSVSTNITTPGFDPTKPRSPLDVLLGR